MRAKLVALFLCVMAMLVLGAAITPGVALAKPKNNHQNHAGSCSPDDFFEFIECLVGGID